MSIQPCRECKHPVSTQAPACPRCGAPRPAEAGWKGSGFEWKSQGTLLGYPLVHVAWGRDAEGRRRVAKGVVAIGQFAVGLVTIAQFGVGVLFGFGQFIAGLAVVAQFAGTLAFGVGQFACGNVAVGQFAAGTYVLAQMGYGQHVWSTTRRDPEAVEYFHNLVRQLRQVIESENDRGVVESAGNSALVSGAHPRSQPNKKHNPLEHRDFRPQAP